MNLELEQTLKKCTPKSSKTKLIDFNKDMTKAIEEMESDKKLEELELQVQSFLNQNQFLRSQIEKLDETVSKRDLVISELNKEILSLKANELELEAQIEDLLADNNEAMMIINEGEQQKHQLQSRLSGVQLNLLTFQGEAEEGSLSVSEGGCGLSLIGEEQQGAHPENTESKANPFEYIPNQSEISRSNYLYQEQGVTTHGTIN